MISLLLLALAFVVAFGSLSAYSSLVERLAAHHPDVYARLGSPTRSMPVWYLRLLSRSEPPDGMGSFLWRLRFRDGPHSTRALGWAVVSGQVLAICLVTLSAIFETP
jgi:hypothetical protein